jgi:predicted DNA binding CopG/RHH family protein
MLMTEPDAYLSHLLSDVILPNLKAVQVSQAEQIAANDRLEQAIDDLRMHLNSQFAHLAAQLTSCRAELAATQAALKAVQTQSGAQPLDHSTLIH